MANVNSNTPARPENEGHNLNLNAPATPMPPSAHSRMLSLHTLCEGPITAEMDFFTLATLCDETVSELIECKDATLFLALAGRLALMLESLAAALDRPVPEHLYDSLTTESLPSEVPFCIGSDAQMLSRYCQALNMALISRALVPETAKPLTGLLFDLVHHLGEFVRAPCFVRTGEGYEDWAGQPAGPLN
ncbi:hypothetical protein [Cronobacter dublinensis]|uniref:hypothetical protein n=1 Tax=Cronobacter dublinensis TaxID=413497 RepID=UPI0024AE7B32|nr:hypothetical protein [Cronobacter dublinensis]EGT4359592.1 hypothetical protein [Cronobacter dublinensis]MDI6478055.1 hypothetical protein [Cronobacter dublinensis]